MHGKGLNVSLHMWLKETQGQDSNVLRVGQHTIMAASYLRMQLVLLTKEDTQRLHA